jgi:hypothetical protein
LDNREPNLCCELEIPIKLETTPKGHANPSCQAACSDQQPAKKTTNSNTTTKKKKQKILPWLRIALPVCQTLRQAEQHG